MAVPIISKANLKFYIVNQEDSDYEHYTVEIEDIVGTQFNIKIPDTNVNKELHTIIGVYDDYKVVFFKNSSIFEAVEVGEVKYATDYKREVKHKVVKPKKKYCKFDELEEVNDEDGEYEWIYLDSMMISWIEI